MPFFYQKKPKYTIPPEQASVYQPTPSQPSRIEQIPVIQAVPGISYPNQNPNPNPNQVALPVLGVPVNPSQPVMYPPPISLPTIVKGQEVLTARATHILDLDNPTPREVTTSKVIAPPVPAKLPESLIQPGTASEPIIRLDPIVPSAPPANLVLGKVDQETEHLEKQLTFVQNLNHQITYQLEHLLLKGFQESGKGLTANIENITTLEYKKIPNINSTVYLLKLLITLNQQDLCCHARVTYNAIANPIYKVDRLLTDMRTDDELGFLEL